MHKMQNKYATLGPISTENGFFIMQPSESQSKLNIKNGDLRHGITLLPNVISRSIS